MIVWTPGMSLADLERQVILAAYRHYRENKTAAAGALGISPRTLYEKLQQYELEDAQRAEREKAQAAADAAFLARQRGTHRNAPESLLLWPPSAPALMAQAGAPDVDGAVEAAQSAGEPSGTPAAAQAVREAPPAPAGAPGPARAPQAAAAAPRAAYGRGSR